MNAKLLCRPTVQCHRTLSAFLAIILTACAGPVSGVVVDWDVANEPNVVVTYAPTAPRPTLAVTQVTMIRAATLLPSVSASSSAVPSVTLAYDERGRVIGGAMPVINYSPTMITGKPCPRVTEWDFELVKSPAPFQDYGISKNPCVVQNAVDDLVRTLWFNPVFQNPQTMAEVEKVYDSDPMNVLGVERTLRDSLIRNFRTGRQNYNDCDKPVYRYLHVDANTALLADNDGSVSGKAIQIILLRTTENRQPVPLHKTGTDF